MKQQAQLASRLSILLLFTAALCGPATLKGGQDPRHADEALIPSFSYEAGVSFLDAKATEWSEKRKCVTCHTTGMALLAQPLVSTSQQEVRKTRAFASDYLEEYLNASKAPKGQHGSLTGMVATTAFLALSDARTKSGLQPITRKGLDYAWRTLDESGTWEDWLQCNWPPFEADTAFAPTLMLIALGELKDSSPPIALRPEDEAGAARLMGWLQLHPPLSLHDKGMRLWAGLSWPKLNSSKLRRQWTRDLKQAQGKEGGWSMASMGAPSWKHDDGIPPSATSESYPTAFALFVLLQTGAKRNQSSMVKGLDWLRSQQRVSGAWFSASPRRDRMHYISHAATALALLVLREESWPGPRQTDK